ncbi:MAG: hypothetical protein IH628_05790 [Proteobacteria bacterium]|nr:hypothetical protein [Pseudomonadota bacterium]
MADELQNFPVVHDPVIFRRDYQHRKGILQHCEPRKFLDLIHDGYGSGGYHGRFQIIAVDKIEPFIDKGEIGCLSWDRNTGMVPLGFQFERGYHI